MRCRMPSRKVSSHPTIKVIPNSVSTPSIGTSNATASPATRLATSKAHATRTSLKRSPQLAPHAGAQRSVHHAQVHADRAGSDADRRDAKRQRRQPQRSGRSQRERHDRQPTRCKRLALVRRRRQREHRHQDVRKTEREHAHEAVPGEDDVQRERRRARNQRVADVRACERQRGCEDNGQRDPARPSRAPRRRACHVHRSGCGPGALRRSRARRQQQRRRLRAAPARECPCRARPRRRPAYTATRSPPAHAASAAAVAWRPAATAGSHQAPSSRARRA